MTETQKHPTEDLYRARGGVELRAHEGEDDGMPTMLGHYAVFDQWTEINSIFEGRFLERFAQGAFAKTIQENRSRIRAIFDHGFDPSVGDKVLGPITELKEDDFGAYYEVPLLDTSYNRDLVPGLEQNLYGASFRFRVVKEEWNDDPGTSAANPAGLPERTVLEAKVMEFGPTPFPAYEGATAGTRSLTDRYRNKHPLRTSEEGAVEDPSTSTGEPEEAAPPDTPEPEAATPPEEPQGTPEPDPESDEEAAPSEPDEGSEETHSVGMSAAARERALHLLLEVA